MTAHEDTAAKLEKLQRTRATREAAMQDINGLIDDAQVKIKEEPDNRQHWMKISEGLVIRLNQARADLAESEKLIDRVVARQERQNQQKSEDSPRATAEAPPRPAAATPEAEAAEEADRPGLELTAEQGAALRRVLDHCAVGAAAEVSSKDAAVVLDAYDALKQNPTPSGTETQLIQAVAAALKRVQEEYISILKRIAEAPVHGK
jgi:hypothetical protein